jgi:hypothetical protein
VITHFKRWTIRTVGTVVLPAALVAGLGAASASGQPKAAAFTSPPTVARDVFSSSTPRVGGDWIQVETFPLIAYGSDAQAACEATAELFKGQGFATRCAYTESSVSYWALLVGFPDLLSWKSFPHAEAHHREHKVRHTVTLLRRYTLEVTNPSVSSACCASSAYPGASPGAAL